MIPLTSRPAFLVALGILASRISGLIRQRVIAHFLGLGDAADALTAAFRVPNLVQNLLGEGSLSASFIPAYSRLRSTGRLAEASALATLIIGVLSLVTATVVLLGVVLAPYIIQIVVPGFTGAKYELTVKLTRIVFPGIGLLVGSAWCLGVLNSHRRFLLSYLSPVVWNGAIIIAALVGSRRGHEDLTSILAFGAVIGSLLQFLVQLPKVSQLLRSDRGRGGVTFHGIAPEVAIVRRTFGPALMARGVQQIGGWFETLVASLLGTGAAAALAAAQMLSLLPISLFSMSISAAELPTLSEATGGDPTVRSETLRAKLHQGWRSIAFFMVPSSLGLLLLGEVIAATVFQSGAFTAADSRFLWWLLAGASVGLLPTGLSRLSASAFQAMGNTVTPFRVSMVRLACSAAVGSGLGFGIPFWFGVDRSFGAVGLTIGGSVGGWVEYAILMRALSLQLGKVRLPLWEVGGLVAVGLVAAGLAWITLAIGLGTAQPIIRGVTALTIFGAGYFGLALTIRNSIAWSLVKQILRHE